MEREQRPSRDRLWRPREVAEYKIAGKTGTSQVRNISTAERAAGVIRNEDCPGNGATTRFNVGYAPHDNPRYACSVIVEHGGGGSAVAAPSRAISCCARNWARCRRPRCTRSASAATSNGYTRVADPAPTPTPRPPASPTGRTVRGQA